MPDRDIVAAITAGDPAGLGAAYDSYAAGLYGYCRSLLADPADAADALQDSFVIAAVKVSSLRNPARFRSWLYAVARHECHGRLRAQAPPADLCPAGEMTDAVSNVVGFAQQDELRRLTEDAIAGLNPEDREVIELNVRHDLGGADLAEVLGVPPGQARALVSRAWARLERALGSLLVARTGRRDCIDLDAMLDAWDGKLTALWRKRVSRHIERCGICSERHRTVLSPAVLRSVLPPVPLPAGLREHLMRLVGDGSAAAAGYRARVVSRAGAFDPAGFPGPATPAAGTAGPGGSGPAAAGPGGARRGARRHAGERSMLVLLAAAGALVLLLGGGVATGYALLAGHGHARAAAHRKELAGAISTTAPPAPVSSPSPVPPSPPSPAPASAPAQPASPTAAPPTSPPAKSPTPTRSASPSPSSSSPSPTPTVTVSLPPVSPSAPTSTPTSTPTPPLAARGNELGMVEATDSFRLT